MLNNRVPDPVRLGKPQVAIPSTRWEYQDSLPSLPLTGAELRVLLYLLKCGARTGEAWPKHQTIARVCRCHQDTARRATKRLEELGLIRIVRGRTFNRYRFPWHAGFVRPESVATSDLPPIKGNPEKEPMIGHNPDLQRQVEAEWAAEPKPTEYVNVTRGAYFGGVSARVALPAYSRERHMLHREGLRQQPHI